MVVGLHIANYTTDMDGIHGIPDGWTLRYEEVSNCVYQVRLKADHGSVVEITDYNDFEGIVARCIESAKEIDKQLGLT